MNRIRVFGSSLRAPMGAVLALAFLYLALAAGPVSAQTAVNVAAQANGGVASASTSLSGYPASGANNGDRKGVGYGTGGVWVDATLSAYPDWLQITFNGQKTITEIDVFGMQDAYTSPADPTSSLVSNSFAMTALEVQTWNGTAWVAVPGGAVTGNDKVWRRFTFPAVTTDRVRVLVSGTRDGYARIAEIEAWTAPPPNVLPTVALTLPAPNTTFPAPGSIALQATGSDTDGTLARIDFYAGATLIGTATGAPYTVKWTGVPAGSYAVSAVATDDSGGTATSAPVNLTVTTAAVNVAALANGGVAIASSNYSANYPAAAVINGDRKGVGNGSGGTWTDGTLNGYPDWLEVAFNGLRAIGEIDVFTLQDAYTNPAVPTETLTFTAGLLVLLECVMRITAPGMPWRGRQ